MTSKSRLPGAIAALALGIGALAAPAAAEDAFRSFVKKQAKYDDVRAELTDAIIKRGVKIDYNGKINDMLKRTGPDVGSNQPIYQDAEFFTFCSARLSRSMAELDPATVAFCPYVMFIYQRAGGANEIVVGYRRLPEGTRSRATPALKEINALLDGIARDAVK